MSRTEYRTTMLKAKMLQFIEKHGNGTNAAKVLGVSRSYVSRLRYGSKVNPTDKILKKLGLIRIVEYKRDDVIATQVPKS